MVWVLQLHFAFPTLTTKYYNSGLGLSITTVPSLYYLVGLGYRLHYSLATVLRFNIDPAQIKYYTSVEAIDLTISITIHCSSGINVRWAV